VAVAANESDGASEVVERERELLLPASRQSEDRLRELLDPAFLEFGAGGRRWSRDATIAALLAEATPPGGRMMRAEAAELVPGVVLLTYEADVEGRRSLRSSVWVWRDGSWRLRFHQGTPQGTGGAPQLGT
jgi:ribonuclease HI